MADIARPLRATRRNVQASGLQKENATTKDMLVRKAAPLQHVRSTLGEIGNKSTAQTIMIGKGGLVMTKPSATGLSSMKENAQVGKAKLSVVNKNVKPVVEQKAGLTAREKPVAATTKPNVLRRITNIATNQLGTSTAAKPKVASSTLTTVKPTLRVRPSLLQSKPKVEIKQEPKQEQTSVVIEKPIFDITSFTQAEIKALELIDSRDRKDTLSVAEYVKDIYQYLRDLEAVYSVPVGYIKQCKHMTYHMRAVLIDWLVGVHRQFKLMPETLYLTVSIFDRYMPIALATQKSNLQLVGITCLLVAAKYEEIMCPTIGDCVYVTDNSYNKKQVADMEMKILDALNFNIGRPLPLSFLRRFTKASEATFLEHSIAKYFMELQLVRHEMCHVAPSLQASAALCLALWLNSEDESICLKDVWSSTLHYFSGYAFPEVADAVKTLATVVVKGHTSTLKTVRSKYASKSGAAEASLFVESMLEKIKTLQ